MSEPTPPTDVPPEPSAAHYIEDPRQRRAALLTVFAVVFIDLLGFGIVIPLLPRIADDYLALVIPGGKDAPLGGMILGLLMASFSAMQFLFAPFWGRLSDRHGRRPILLIGLVGSVIFYALFGFALELPHEKAVLIVWLLFLCRIGQGVAGATIATAQAFIADCTPPEKRKHGMAMIGAAFGIGFTFGPLIGAASLWIAPANPGVIGFVAAGLSLLALILGLRRLPETRRPGGPSARRGWLRLHGLVHVLRNPAIGFVVLTFFLATIGFAGFESTFALINKDALKLADQYNFLLFAYVGFVLMLTQGFLYRKLAARLSEVTFMVMGILLMGLGVVSLAGVSMTSTSGAGVGRTFLIVWAMVSVTFAVVGFAFLTPSAQALISRRTNAEQQGEVLGVNQSASAMARILGPIIALSLYKLTDSHMLPYLFGGGLILLMLPLMPRVGRPTAPESSPDG